MITVFSFVSNFLTFPLCSGQTVPLCAHLDLSTLRLSTPDFDFGYCYVGQMQTREVNIYSCGAHTYWKSVIGEHRTVFQLCFVCILQTLTLAQQSCSQTCPEVWKLSRTFLEVRYLIMKMSADVAHETSSASPHSIISGECPSEPM